MTERSVLDPAPRVDSASPAAAPLRSFGGFIKAAFEGWLAMAARSATDTPYRFPMF